MGEAEEQVVKNLEHFHHANKLKTLIYTFIGSQLCSTKERNNLLKVFKEIDADGDGVIRKEELVSAFNMKSTSGLTETEIEKILNMIDTNGSGKIDFSEFLGAATNQEKIIN